MPHFLLIYMFDGTPLSTPEQQAEGLAAWRAWMDSISASLVDRGNPVGTSWTVTAQGAAPGGNAIPILGYSIVSADSIEAACDLVKGNPLLPGGGRIEVTPIIQMG